MKTFYSTTITFIAAAIAVSASCQKISENDISSETQTLITRILPVSGELWTPESSKSTFEPGTGLYLTGDEHISVYYSPYVEGYTDLADISDHPVEAVPTGGGLYTFSHEALDAESYNYYFIMPHSEQNRSGNSATRIAVRLSPVQFPGDNDIDASNDYLVGRPQTNVGLSEKLEVTEFKRLFAPFRINVIDSKGILGNEKLYTATLSFGKEASSNSNTMLGYAYLSVSDVYEENGVDSFTSASRSNAVSAVSNEGISNAGEGYPVWFMLSPMVFEAGTDAVLTVSAGTKTVSRTVSLPFDVKIEAGKFNELTFDISGDGATAAEESLTQPFIALESASSSLVASDGNTYAWGFNGCRFNYADGGHSGVRLNGGTIDLPAFPGKTLKGLRLFSHKRNGGAATTMETDNIVTVKSGDADVASGNFNYFAVSPDGGVLELDIPAEYSSSPLTLFSNTTSSLISAITFIFENPASSDPDAPRFSAAVPTDSGYENLYLGREVTVTGENLDKVTAFVVDGITAPVVGTPAASEAHFVMPAEISGTEARPVTLSAIVGSETEPVDLASITVYPFYCTKGLRLGVGSNSAANYTEDGRSMSFLLLERGEVISAQKWVDDGIDPFAASGNNTVTTQVNEDGKNVTRVTGSETDYYSVTPYIFLTTSGTLEDGDAKLAFQNPSGSTSQLRNHRLEGGNTSVIGDNRTLGTPVVKFRILYNDSEVKAAVSDGTLSDILAHDTMCGASAPAFGTAEGSSSWIKGSVLAVQYLNYGHASISSDSADDFSDVKNQGYIYVRDVTCADLSTGFPLYPTSGYVEFDLYWSNPLN